MDEMKINKVQIRNLQIEDYDQLAQSFTRVYSDGSDVFWTHKQIEKLIRIFPEGQIVTVVDEKIVGCALSIIVNYDDVKNDHTYAQVTGKETFNTHNPKGNILYGIEVFIHPQYRGLRLARRMYEYRKELCETLNLKAIMFGGRIPNYHKYADQIRPKEYIDKVKQKEIYDPVLTFQLSNDFHVRKVMRNYLPNDEESKHYACLLQWDNIYYQPPTQEYVSPKTTVRVGLVQWQMRTYKTLDDLFEQVEFFVDAVSDYKSDFVLFPEYFNAPLMAKFNDEGESEAIRGLAAYTNEIRERFVKLAISYNINIIFTWEIICTANKSISVRKDLQNTICFFSTVKLCRIGRILMCIFRPFCIISVLIISFLIVPVLIIFILICFSLIRLIRCSVFSYSIFLSARFLLQDFSFFHFCLSTGGLFFIFLEHTLYQFRFPQCRNPFQSSRFCQIF